MKKIEMEELKRIQLDVMQVFHDFCVANDIKYSLGGGSLLGAIRHNGYIPWDDDIDVYMMRSEYNKFMSLFPELYQGIYKVASFERDKSWNRAYGKLYDTRNVLMEQKTSNEKHLGVNLDLFPIDYVPSDEAEWLSYNKKRKFFLALFYSKLTTLRDDRPLSKNLGVIALKCLTFFIPLRFLGRIINRNAQRYNGKENEYVFTTAEGWRVKKPYHASVYNTYELHQFEDREFYIMAGYDEALRNLYGNDYMQLPPENKRITHYYVDAYWK